ncbi:MAG TPA: helix-turn-helix domain-containing protein [Pyrinomonadaceae bacterium]|jgi:two-component system response regulator YesN
MDRRVQIIISSLQEDLRREMILDELAHSLNLSRSRLQHLFKSETGLPPAQYLRRLRLERAKDLMRNSVLSVKQVMTSVGISDKSHFERAFKKAYGLTPRQYRMSHLALSLGKGTGNGR